MEDKDNVRVDILKFRRKAFLSYPEGSPERKTFLRIVLQNELMLKENEVPQEFMDTLLEGEKVVLKSTIKNILIPVGSLLFSTIAFVETWHKGFAFTFLFLLIGIGSLVEIVSQVNDFLKYKKSMGVIKEYSNDIKKQMNRISNDIKRLDGPRGF